jgi:hypothetical protein
MSMLKSCGCRRQHASVFILISALLRRIILLFPSRAAPRYLHHHQ